MTISVTFLCPHNAAKSVAAAAFFGRAAAARGLDVTTATAGTEPDDEVLPIVRQHLEENDLPVDSSPRLVTADDLAADHVVNIGCDLPALSPTNSMVSWDIPNFSDDPDAAFIALEKHAYELAEAIAIGIR